jgi:hypothetical protein
MWISLRLTLAQLRNSGQLLQHDSTANDLDGSTAAEGYSLDAGHLLLNTDYISNRSLEEIFPTPAQSVVLWQAYLENVHQLCQIVHPPSFKRTVESAPRSFHAIPKATLALLFSIYNFAITSMSNTECEKKLGHPKSGLLQRFQYATRQALVKAHFLRSSDIVTLQAFVHFLVINTSTGPNA